MVMSQTYNSGWNEIALLGERFLIAPKNLAYYLLMQFDAHIYFDLIKIAFTPPPEVVTSINGRFLGQNVDSGWVVLYRDTGLIGLITLILASVSLVVRGVKSCFASLSLKNIYMLVALLNCLLTALFMRFQIFPVWVFCSLVLIASMVLWVKDNYECTREAI